MTKEAEKFKFNNKINYQKLTMKEFNNLPLLSGIYSFSVDKLTFDLICIKNDDASIVKNFWQGNYDRLTLTQWLKITEKEGIYFDIGSHTGLFTIIGLLSNPKNFLISIEPNFINLGRLRSNLRLNDLLKNNSQFLGAASNFSGEGYFSTHYDNTFLSKGGHISSSGEKINIIKLDDITINDNRKIRGIKIDTEGEDYNVLLGAEKIINNFRPDIIIEVREKNKLEIFQFLAKYNYKTWLISDKVTSNVIPVKLSNLQITSTASVNIYATIENIN